jgi:FKBP-type peptidyl-prolyl cis-trans isomerase FkpA
VQQTAFKNGLSSTGIFVKFMLMRKVFVNFFIIIIFFFSCYKKDVNITSCNYDPCALKASDAEITELQSYLANAGVTGATEHCSGMYYKIDSVGIDKTPSVCSYVSVNYKGMLVNGSVFDSTAGTPVSFNLISLIEGWKKGIPLIKKGGKIHLFIPPSLGYGATDQKNTAGAIVIPANSILIFDIELADVQ